MFDIVDTLFSYERDLIVSSFLQDFSRGKGSSLQLICNVHTAFLLFEADICCLFLHPRSAWVWIVWSSLNRWNCEAAIHQQKLSHSCAHINTDARCHQYNTLCICCICSSFSYAYAFLYPTSIWQQQLAWNNTKITVCEQDLGLDMTPLMLQTHDSHDSRYDCLRDKYYA